MKNTLRIVLVLLFAVSTGLPKGQPQVNCQRGRSGLCIAGCPCGCKNAAQVKNTNNKFPCQQKKKTTAAKAAKAT